MRTVRTLITVLIVGSLASAGGATVAAGQQSGTRCTAEFTITATPGISETPSSGPYHSKGEDGKMNCADGRTGTYGTDGRYGTKDPVTCSSGGEGWGVGSYTIAGVNTKDTYTVTFAGLSSGKLQGKFSGERFSGNFVYTPIEGDCVTKPMTKGTVRADGILLD